MLPGLRFLVFALLLAGSPETQNRPAPGPGPLFDCYYSNFSTIPATIGRVVSGWGVITAYDRTMGPAWVPAPVVEAGRTFLEAQDLNPKFRGEQAGRIERSVMSEKAALVADAARGVVTREDGGARDAGSRQCVAYIFDRERTRYEVVYLGSYGDTNDERVTNDAPAARELLEWLQEVGIAEGAQRRSSPTGFRGGKVSIRFTGPDVLYQEPPRYTEAARAAGIEGEVRLEVTVLKDGSVGDVRVVRSLDARLGLDGEAVRAARVWRFRPGAINGTPIPSTVSLSMEFRLR